MQLRSNGGKHKFPQTIIPSSVGREKRIHENGSRALGAWSRPIFIVLEKIVYFSKL